MFDRKLVFMTTPFIAQRMKKCSKYNIARPERLFGTAITGTAGRGKMEFALPCLTEHLHLRYKS